MTAEDARVRSTLPEPHVVVRLDVTPNDYVLVQRHFLRRSYWAAFPIWAVVLALVCGGLFIFWQQDGEPTLPLLLRVGIIFLLGTLAYPPVCSALERLKLAQFHQEMTEARKQGLPVVYFVLSPGGYALVSAADVELWRWEGVRDLIVLDQHVVLINERGAGNFVARHMFDKPENYERFLAVVKGYYNECR